VLAREGQEVLHDARGAPGFGVDHLGRGALIGREALFTQQQLGEGRDPRERVVELVRYAGDELPDGRHLFGLDQLLLQHLLVGDVADDAQDFFVELRRRVRDLNGPDFTVLPVEGSLEQPRLAPQRPLIVAQGAGKLVVREQGSEKHP